MKYWYALLTGSEDNDWGTGTFDRNEAIDRMENSECFTQIAVIDADYDDEGNPSSDPVCIDIIHSERCEGLIDKFIMEHATEVESYGDNEVSFNMIDVNEEINGKPWEDHFRSIAGRTVEFSYGVGNWVTARFY